MLPRSYENLTGTEIDNRAKKKKLLIMKRKKDSNKWLKKKIMNLLKTLI